jgi:hypothetical protein
VLLEQGCGIRSWLLHFCWSNIFNQYVCLFHCIVAWVNKNVELRWSLLAPKEPKPSSLPSITATNEADGVGFVGFNCAWTRNVVRWCHLVE